MAQFIHSRDPDSKELEQILSEIPKFPGTCIFIDLVNSTQIKYESSLSAWGKVINNTFNFISLLNDFPDNIVKGIGDEIMLFIPDDELKKKKSFNNYFALLEEIYATLFNIKNFPRQDLFLYCKVSMHYCTEVYNITFLEGFNDYYGKDIDITARLMSRACANRIVISEAYYEKALEDLELLDLPTITGCFSEISEKHEADFKGVPYPFGLRYIDI